MMHSKERFSPPKIPFIFHFAPFYKCIIDFRVIDLMQQAKNSTHNYTQSKGIIKLVFEYCYDNSLSQMFVMQCSVCTDTGIRNFSVCTETVDKQRFDITCNTQTPA